MATLHLAGAQNGIRTRDLVLTKNALYRLSYLGFRGFAIWSLSILWWWGQDSNLRSLSATSLQPVGFNHSPTPPRWVSPQAKLKPPQGHIY